MERKYHVVELNRIHALGILGEVEFLRNTKLKNSSEYNMMPNTYLYWPYPIEANVKTTVEYKADHI